MPTFTVYPELNHGAKQSVEAPNARRAAEAYWEERVLDGYERANRDYPERIIVEHADGPNVDPSATWLTDEDGTYARFDVSVAAVDASAVEAK